MKILIDHVYGTMTHLQLLAFESNARGLSGARVRVDLRAYARRLVPSASVQSVLPVAVSIHSEDKCEPLNYYCAAPIVDIGCNQHDEPQLRIDCKVGRGSYGERLGK